jgi:hypothetical protein
MLWPPIPLPQEVRYLTYPYLSLAELTLYLGVFDAALLTTALSTLPPRPDTEQTPEHELAERQDLAISHLQTLFAVEKANNSVGNGGKPLREWKAGHGPHDETAEPK